MELVCKCHGVSGSCTVRVCWRKLKSFRAIGEELLKKFDGATQVRVTLQNEKKKLRPSKREIKRPSKKDLVYFQDSPDYCLRNETYVKLTSFAKSTSSNH